MIFNIATGGSASAGSWKFKALEEKPATVYKNTMIAVSATLPTTITVADELPENPSDNDVWFHILNPDDDKVFSDGSVPIHIVGAYQLDQDSETATATTTIPDGGISVNAATFRTKAKGKTGTYLFTFDGTAWKLDGDTASLSDCGITITTGTPSSSNTITVSYDCGWKMVDGYYAYCGVWHVIKGLPPSGTSLCKLSRLGLLGSLG